MSTNTLSEQQEQAYEIHISDVRTFKQCRRKWWFSSNLPGNKGLEPRVPYMPFFTGRAIHYCLEMYYEDGTHPTEVFEAWLPEELNKIKEQSGALWAGEEQKVQEQITLIEGMMDHYALWAPHVDRNYEVVATELEFNIPLDVSKNVSFGRVQLSLAGRFDGVVRYVPENTFWLFESKTTRSIKEMKRSLANDEQAGLYSWAASTLVGKPIAGVLYNLMRKKIPIYPRQLGDKYLSQAKNQDTTMEVYWEAIKETHQIAPDDKASMEMAKDIYADMLLHLEQKGNTFFERWEVRRSQSELSTLVSYLLATAAEMIDPETVLYPSPGQFNCNFCHFRAPCLAMNAGANYEFLLAEEYTPRQRWDPMEGKEGK